jgi:SAM-dependent methyltransferase
MATVLGKIRKRLWKLSLIGLSRGPKITRYSMYHTLQKVGSKFPNQEGDVLSVSHSVKLCDVLGIKPKSLVEANYPEHNFLSLQFPDESFDFVLSDQVLEHVEGNPQQAIDESLRLLRPGGIAIHTTCFINPVHGAPSDYWRFTPEALKLLGKNFSKIIDCGGWGNFETWLLIRDGLRRVRIPHANWHPLHRIAIKNDPEWPIVTWLVAQK